MPFTLKKFAEIKGWKFNKFVANGEEQGYLVTIAQGQGFKNILVTLVGSTESDKAKVIAFLSEQKKELKLAEVTFDNSVLVIKVKETLSQLKEEDLNHLLNTIINYLKDNQISVEKHCVFCGEVNANTDCLIEGVGYYTHAECYEKAVGERKKAVEEYNSLEKNYFKGTIGALVGGLVVSVLWMVLSYFGWFAAIVGLLIGRGALKGYELFGGRLGKMTRWIILTVVIISVLVGELGAWGIAMITEGAAISIENYIILFTYMEDIVSDFIVPLGVGLFLAFLGIISLFKDLKGDGDSVITDIK